MAAELAKANTTIADRTVPTAISLSKPSFCHTEISIASKFSKEANIRSSVL
jgi:hypothetical protein